MIDSDKFCQSFAPQARTQRPPKASLQFQLLVREKGPFPELNRRGNEFSGAMRISGLKDSGRDWGGCPPVMAEGKSEPEAGNYPPSLIRHAEKGNETIDLIICNRILARKEKACKPVADRMCLRKRGG